MALNLFSKCWQSLEICKGLWIIRFNGSKRLVLHDCMIQSKQHLFKKQSVISWRPAATRPQGIRNDDNQNINADFLCPKVDLLQLQISCRTPFNRKKKKRQWASPYLNAEKSTVWLYNTVLSTLGLQWQYIQNDSLPVLCCNIYIIDPVKWHHHKFLLFGGPQSMPTNRSPLTMEIKAGRIQKSNWKVRIIWLAPSLSWVKTADIKSFFSFWGKCTFEVREDDVL